MLPEEEPFQLSSSSLLYSTHSAEGVMPQRPCAWKKFVLCGIPLRSVHPMMACSVIAAMVVTTISAYYVVAHLHKKEFLTNERTRNIIF